jgi:hypothetical protein
VSAIPPFDRVNRLPKWAREYVWYLEMSLEEATEIKGELRGEVKRLRALAGEPEPDPTSPLSRPWSG